MPYFVASQAGISSDHHRSQSSNESIWLLHRLTEANLCSDFRRVEYAAKDVIKPPGIEDWQGQSVYSCN
jgi:hypothetical protein